MEILKECLLIFIFSALCAMVYNAVSPKGVALVGEWDTTKGVISAVTKGNPVAHDIEIDDVNTAKEIYDIGQVVFVDARLEEVFNDGHIQGAISLPMGAYQDMIEQFIETYPLPTPIVTYCSGRECQDSHELAQLFLQIGYSDVRVFIDGYPAWKKNGFPVAKLSGQGTE